MSEHCLARNYCIAIRNELHFDELHVCCMIQCFIFGQLLYSHYKYTLKGNIHPTNHDSTAIKYLYTLYAWIQNHTVCLNWYGVSAQNRVYYEKKKKKKKEKKKNKTKKKKRVLFMEKFLLINFRLFLFDVTYKWNSWLANVTFDWRHVMEMAVECNNQLCSYFDARQKNDFFSYVSFVNRLYFSILHCWVHNVFWTV